MNTVAWLIEVTIRPGALDAFRALTDDMVASTMQEPGAIIYERFVSEDGGTAHLYERYVDSEAAVRHLDTFNDEFASSFLELVDRQRATLYGRQSTALRDVFDRMGATYFEPVAGFAK